nr:putative upf0481 protein [Quercus suber]
MILVDGMFILEYFLRQSNPCLLRNDPKIIAEWMHPILKVDLTKTLGRFNVQVEHFTDLLRFFYLGEEIPYRRSRGAKLSYSTTQLHEAGVELKGVKFDEKIGCYRGYRRFLDIRFDLNNGVLEIPCIKLNDEKIRLIRNIIALEQSHYVGDEYVTDFFVILDFLIDNSKDVDLLCDKGILVNYLGNSNAAASAVNSLNTNILWDYINHEYSM